MNSLFARVNYEGVVEIQLPAAERPASVKHHKLQGSNDAQVSPDGTEIFTLDEYEKLLRAYPVSDPFEPSTPRTVEIPHEAGQYGGTVAATTFAVNDTLIALANAKHTIGEVPLRLLDRQTFGTVADLPPMGASTEMIALSPDSRRLAVAHLYGGDSATSGLLRVYRLDEEGRPYDQPPAAFQYSRRPEVLAFSEDGEYVACCRGVPFQNCFGMNEYPVTLYNANTAQVAQRWEGYIGVDMRCSVRVGNRLFMGRNNPYTKIRGFPPLAVLDFSTQELRYGPVCRTPDGTLFDLSVSGLVYDAWQNRLYLSNSQSFAETPWYYLDLNDMDGGYHPLEGMEALGGALGIGLWNLQKGRGKIQGQVRDRHNQPAARTVQALSRAPVLCVGQARSDAATGQYQILLENKQPVDVAFRAEDGENLNDLFYTRITPADAGEPPVHPPLSDWLAYNDAAVGTMGQNSSPDWVVGLMPPENRPRAEGVNEYWEWVLPFAGAQWADGGWKHSKTPNPRPTQQPMSNFVISEDGESVSYDTADPVHGNGGAWWVYGVVIKEVVEDGAMYTPYFKWQWDAYTHPSQSHQANENGYMQLEDGTKWHWSADAAAWVQMSGAAPAPSWWDEAQDGAWPPPAPLWWGHPNAEMHPPPSWWDEEAETLDNWPPPRPDWFAEEMSADWPPAPLDEYYSNNMWMMMPQDWIGS